MVAISWQVAPRPRARRPGNTCSIAAMYLVSGISGAKAADMAAVAPVALSRRCRSAARGDGRNSMALLVRVRCAHDRNGAALSLVLITIGSVTGRLDRGFVHGRAPAERSSWRSWRCALVVWWRYHRSEDLSRHVRRAPAGARSGADFFVAAFPALILALYHPRHRRRRGSRPRPRCRRSASPTSWPTRSSPPGPAARAHRLVGGSGRR